MDRERNGQVAQPEYLLIKRVGYSTFVEPKQVPVNAIRDVKTFPNTFVAIPEVRKP